jgi:hypothetical protein
MVVESPYLVYLNWTYILDMLNVFSPFAVSSHDAMRHLKSFQV